MKPIVAAGLAAIGLVWAKAASNRPIGMSEAMIVPKTMPIGRSRSVMSRLSLPAAARARLAASAARRPATIGPIILSRVQIAATPIVPAPMKRTFDLNTEPTNAARSLLVASAGSIAL